MSRPIVITFIADSSSSVKWWLYPSTLAHRDAVEKGRSPYHYVMFSMVNRVENGKNIRFKICPF
jgi:hypothetical protein